MSKENSVFYELYVVRIKYNENNKLVTGMSKPCICCLNKLKKTNITIIHYTADTGIISEYLDNMKTNHLSRYYRNFVKHNPEKKLIYIS